MDTEFLKGWDRLGFIGEGSFGVVVKIENHNRTEVRALKVQNDSKDVEREITIHKLLTNHRNVVKFFASGLEDGLQMMMLEYCEGGDLWAQCPMFESEARDKFTQLLCGVDYLHKNGIAHRDIKPENLLLDKHGVLKIADFGLSTVFQHQGEGEKR